METFPAIPTSTNPWDRQRIFAKPIIENQEPLVSLSYAPEKIIVSPQYFIQQLPGALPDLFARQSVLTRLNQAAQSLPTGYKFVIFDAWRSIQTQQTLFDTFKSQIQLAHPSWSSQQLDDATLRIVARPSTNSKMPSPHNTGGSIDLSIANPSGHLLDMGSPFDDTGETARTDYLESPTQVTSQNARDNRRLLYHSMINAGFSNYVEEWWHFDYGNQNWADQTMQTKAFYGATKPSFPWRVD